MTAPAPATTTTEPADTTTTLRVVGLDLSVLARFNAKVDKTSDCWNWTAFIDRNGYGRLSLGGRSGRMEMAHRVSWMLFRGEIPPRFDIDHLCRNRRCVNPDHLDAVTHQENNRRGVAGTVNAARQRAKTHCPSGHAYDASNTAFRSDGRRRCKECERARSSAYRKARR